jgi:hypothetical protein
MMKNYRWSKGFVFFAIFIPGVLFLGLAIKLLWNAILPSVIHVSPVSYLQALGILVLSRILFGGFNKRHWGAGRDRHMMKEHFARFTPEERERFKQEWRGRWGRKDPGEQANA